METNKISDFLGEKPKGFLIVGIGASAGGIQALKEFFQQVPVDSGIAYVVILHMSPDHDSKLAQVLQTTTSIPVLKVTEKTKIEPDHIYVVSPNQHLIMEDGSVLPSINLHMEERRAPVDIFFRSLAEAYGPNAICVILSGSGANGSMGLKRIKELGGLAYVQNPREAEFSEMPRNAIATELVDEVLPVGEIPAKIIAYRNSIGTIEIVDEPEKRPEQQQQALREIFTQLRVRTGNDFSNYKRPTLLRRIERRISVRNLPDISAYAAFVQQNTEEASALLKDLLISVTNFFRDKVAFEAIEKEIVPALLSGKKSDKEIRIWVAGCATGEEAYSLAMLLAEQTTSTIEIPKIQIFATDIDEAAIATAREGLYTFNDTADVSAERLMRFFTSEGEAYRVKREIREMIVFATHNVLKDPPFSHLDLITCRNVLIYLNATAQERVLETFHFALKPGGYLFLGSSESVDGAGDLYATLSREHHIYQAREVSTRTYPIPQSVPHFQFARAEPSRKFEEREGRTYNQISAGELHQKLLEQYAPPSVVINEDYDILHLSAKAGSFLGFSGGEPTSNLLKLIRPELRLELRSALYQAVQRQMPIEAKNIIWDENGVRQAVTIHVRPVTKEGDTSKGFILVIFDKNEKEQMPEPVVLTSDEPVAKQLEEELIYVREQLKRSVEQHEYQKEELKASNEELQAMVEELRSSAEELETSKEELQSINEELRTVNQELKVKIEEIGVTSNNLQNLINSAEVGTIFLDRSFRIRLYTPAILDLFNLIPSDYGRLLSDITHRVDYDNLLQDAYTVLEKLTVVEREVTTTDNRAFMMRVLPYRTSEDRINGVVITFFDITKRKEAEKALQQSEQHLRLLIESARDYAIFTLDTQRIITKWNHGAEMMMGYSEAEIIGKPGDILFTQEDRARQAPEKETKTAEMEGHAENERWHVRKDRSRFWGSGSVSPIRDSEGQLLGFVKIMRDLTERKEAEEALGLSEERFRTLADAIPQIIWTNDETGKATYFNKRWFEYSGLTYEQSVGPGWEVIVHPDDAPASKERWRKSLEAGELFDTEFRLRRADGDYRWHLGRNVPLKDDTGKVVGWFGTATDITEQKSFEEELSRQVADRTRELQRSNEDLRQFAHVASHDLKEPVRKITTYYRRIIDEFGEELPRKAKTYLDRIEGASNRLYTMIDGVLAYSKYRNLQQAFQPVDLKETIRQIQTDLEVLVETKKAQIITSKLPTLIASPILMHQLFYNLILNALKFSKESVPSRIRIAAQKVQQDSQAFWQITVSDNGIGFEPQYNQEIFGAFTRLHPVDEYEGTGLGLALCKKIVERHHGSISALGRENEGATFSILLPAHS